jgi:hypothetical protein
MHLTRKDRGRLAGFALQLFLLIKEVAVLTSVGVESKSGCQYVVASSVNVSCSVG